MAQGVKASALGSGHDPRVLESSPALGSLFSGEPAALSLSLPASLPTSNLHLSNKILKNNNKKRGRNLELGYLHSYPGSTTFTTYL